MKKNHHHNHKFKPLIELYNHVDYSYFNSKMDSEPENKCLKNFNCENLVQAKMLENENFAQTAEEPMSGVVFDCQADNRSCISKDSLVVMAVSNHTGGADHTDVMSSAASVSSLSPEIMEKSLNGESTTSSFGDQLSHEGATSSSKVHNCSNDAVLPCEGSSDRSDPASETFTLRNEQDGAITCVPFEAEKKEAGSLVVKISDSNFANLDVNKEVCELLKPETGLNDPHLKAIDSSERSDGNEHFNIVTPIANAQEPVLQGQITSHGDESEELVDVKVCDICGDAGREALLALCSVCSDGAEHIYCMRNKMDNVPDKGWMCEECSLMQEPKGHTQVEIGTADSPFNPSCLGEFIQPSRRKSSSVRRADEPSTKHLRHGPSIEMSSALKQRTFEESDYPSKSHISSMKSIDGGTNAVLQVSSSGERPRKRAFEPASSSCHRALKSEKLLCKGSLYKSKTDNISKLNMKVQQSTDDIPRMVTAKGSDDSKSEKNFPNKKLSKSLSFCGSVPSDVQSPQFFCISKPNGIKCESEGDSTKNVFTPEKKTNRLCLSSTRSCSMKVRSSRTKMVPKIATKMVPEIARPVPFLDKKAIQASEITVKTSAPLAQDEKKHANILAGPVGEKLSSGNSSDAIRCIAKDVKSYPGYKGSRPFRNVKLKRTAKDNNHHSVASGKVMQHALHLVKPMPTLAPENMAPSASSAVPTAEYIWRGEFKLDKSGELPNYCSGLQAHVSSCASSKVHEVVSKFGPKLEFKEVPRSETRLTYLQRNCPTEQDIALYFFAEDLQSYKRSYKILLDSMMEKDLFIEANFDGIQLLVLPSNLLPVTSQRWNSLFYLWGVFKVRKVDEDRSLLPCLDVATLNKDLRTPITYGPRNKCVSTSQASHYSIQAPEPVHPLLQSSALTKSNDQSCDLDTSSVKCLRVLEGSDVRRDTIQSIYDLKQKTFLCGALHTDDMLRGIQSDDDQDIKCSSKTAIFPPDQLNRENVSLAISPGGNVASQSSISIDSGPCGSSDWYAKSDEERREHSEKPSSSRPLSLDLCLGFSSHPEEQVDLDLVLGFPSKYQAEDYTRSRNTRDEDMSLFLSLGLPCSDA